MYSTRYVYDSLNVKCSSSDPRNSLEVKCGNKPISREIRLNIMTNLIDFEDWDIDCEHNKYSIDLSCEEPLGIAEECIGRVVPPGL